MPAERNVKLDHAKLFFMFCVVTGHVIANYEAGCLPVSSLLFFIYLFHVPGFVFISGLFAKNQRKEQPMGQSGILSDAVSVHDDCQVCVHADPESAGSAGSHIRD